MRKNYGLYFFAGGLLLVTIQFMMLVFGYVNADPYAGDQVFYVAKDTNIGDFISGHWAGLIGTLLLIILFVRRLTRGPEAMMVLVGVLLWIIQLFGMYETDMQLGAFVAQYLLGIVGVVGVAVAGIHDAYLMKSAEPDQGSNSED